MVYSLKSEAASNEDFVLNIFVTRWCVDLVHEVVGNFQVGCVKVLEITAQNERE